jgi:hypothetical protein
MYSDIYYCVIFTLTESPYTQGCGSWIKDISSSLNKISHILKKMYKQKIENSIFTKVSNDRAMLRLGRAAIRLKIYFFLICFFSTKFISNMLNLHNYTYWKINNMAVSMLTKDFSCHYLFFFKSNTLSTWTLLCH